MDADEPTGTRASAFIPSILYLRLYALDAAAAATR